MAASYPKPDAQRVTRNKQAFDWTNLPAEGREGDPPSLPEWRLWHDRTREWWAELWAKPQAVMWAPDGSTLFALACLYDDLIAQRSDVVKVSAEMRQHEDRHGLNPKAMMQMRWRVGEAAPMRAATNKRRASLKVVE